MSEAVTASAGAPTHHTQDEIEETVRALDDGQLLRLAAKGRAAAFGTDMTREDVFYEAVTQLLEGRRPWRLDVHFEAHMTMVMKSIGSNRRRSQCGRQEVELDTLDTEASLLHEMSAEQAVIGADQASLLLNQIEQLFADDPEGFAIFLARSESMEPDEACDFAGIECAAYDTVSRRVRRRLAREFSAGAPA